MAFFFFCFDRMINAPPLTLSSSPVLFLSRLPVPRHRVSRLDGGPGDDSVETKEGKRISFFFLLLTSLPLCCQVKQALWAGGIARSNRADGKGSTPGLRRWEDLVRKRKRKGGW